MLLSRPMILILCVKWFPIDFTKALGVHFKKGKWKSVVHTMLFKYLRDIFSQKSSGLNFNVPCVDVGSIFKIQFQQQEGF